MKSKPDEAAKIIGKFMGVTPKEVKEQLSGVYNIPMTEMPKAFTKAKETTSYYASGEIISQLLMSKGQIKAIPTTEATFDAQFVTALTKK
jgi:NitT/TauT family transport system substrate-binding protein